MKKILITVTLVSATASASAFAFANHLYGEVGMGGARVLVGSPHFEINTDNVYQSETVFQVKAGAGYHQKVSDTAPIFWGIDGHYNYYDFYRSTSTIDAAFLLGTELGSCLEAYAKIGAEYFIEDEETKPKFGVGIDYRIAPQFKLAVEINSTLVSNSDHIIAAVSGGTISLQYYL